MEEAFQNDLQQLDEMFVISETVLEEHAASIEKNKQLIDTIKTNCLEIKRLRTLMQDRIKEELEALCREHDQLSEGENKSAAMSEMEKQEQQLRQEYEVVNQNQHQLSSLTEALASESKRLQAEKEELLEEKEKLDNETTVMIPIRREEVNLFNLISNIRWDFDGSQDEVKGYISNKSEVKPFCYDKRKCSQFFITNALWDAMVG